MPQAARRYCPHHVGHYLGMDVHDTPELSRSQPLQPGMAVTVEPGVDKPPHCSTWILPGAHFNFMTYYTGLYIGEDNDEAPERFRGLGIRIEDDVVIRNKGGPLILSSGAPKTVSDIEQACAHR